VSDAINQASAIILGFALVASLVTWLSIPPRHRPHRRRHLTMWCCVACGCIGTEAWSDAIPPSADASPRWCGYCQHRSRFVVVKVRDYPGTGH
jgi:hypothetical protein